MKQFLCGNCVLKILVWPNLNNGFIDRPGWGTSDWLVSRGFAAFASLTLKLIAMPEPCIRYSCHIIICVANVRPHLG